MNLPKAKTFVPPSGRLDAPFVLIGEQPGRVEVRERKVFVGPAGNELNLCLNAADIGRPLCYLTNVIKDLDHSKDAYIQLYKANRLLKEPIISPAGQAYLDFLQWELSQTSAKYFGAIGALALFALTGRTGITKWRGSILDCILVDGRKVIPMLHPATVIAPKFQYLNRRLIIFDLKRIKQYQAGLIVPTERETIVAPTFIQTMDFLNYCQQKGLGGSRISYDIEVFMNRAHKQVSCIAFAVNRHAMCIPFVDSAGDWFLIRQEAEIWQKIAEILEDPEIRICGQNLVFDGHFLLRIYGIHVTNMDDTMIAQNTIMPDYPKGLDFITALWTDHPYYKADGKEFFKGSGKYEKFWIYNATDANICDEALPKQLEEIERLHNTEIYKNQIALIEPLVYMMEKGLKVDVQRMETAGRDYEKKIEEAQRQLDLLAGRPLNAKSPKQLKDYFWGEKKIKPFQKAGKDTYNDDAMKRLIRKDVPEAKLIQHIRRYTKLRSTYLDLEKIDTDGKIRCSYNPVGTRYSRLSSSKNIWGTGGNQQNWPHALQEFLIPDPGYVYYAFDLGQAENRIVAYVGEVLEMIDCFEQKIDVHSKTARMIMSVYYHKKIPENINVRSLSPLGDGSKDWRHWGKRSNHCVLADTNVLTKNGWTSVSQAAYDNCEIACFSDKGNKITFEEPSNWIVEEYSGNIISFKGKYLSQRVTPEHRIPYRERDTNINDSLKWETAQDKKLYSTREWPLAGYYEEGSIKFPGLYLRLMVAFQADGTWDWKVPKWKLKNPVKIARLRMILDLLKVDYTEHRDKNDEYTTLYIRAHNMERDFLRIAFTKNKNWTWDLMNLTKEGLAIFCDEIVRWDGDGKCYWTSIKENAEIVQTIFHLAGFKAYVGWACKETRTYRVSKIDKAETRCDITPRTSEYVRAKRIFCPTVSTGAILIRHGGKISITGNSLNYDMGYKNFSLANELTETDGKLVYLAYHQLYPGVQQAYHAYVKQQLRSGRILTNLMDRRTLFLGALSGSKADATFKEAYSCIPQGTVGDVINKRGLNYIYYNQDLFAPVELLRQVHDEIGFQIPLTVSWPEHARILKLIKKSLETPLVTHNGRTFVIPADLTMGIHLNKDLGLDIEFDENLLDNLEYGWRALNDQIYKCLESNNRE